MSCAFRRHDPEREGVRIRTLSEVLPPPQPALPCFENIAPPPDLMPWLAGNCGIEGVHHFEAQSAGPHAVITALMHGNEYCGAQALTTLLERKIRPVRGRISLIFLNIAAFLRFDPQQPTFSRFVDEDMNRLWCSELIRSQHQSLEMQRVRAICPIMETADLLLDIHSMLWSAPPLLLSGLTTKSLMFGSRLSALMPHHHPWVVQDGGHDSGPRLIDYARFASNRTRATACLLEAGQHWQPESAQTSYSAALLFLAQAGVIAPDTLPPNSPAKCPARHATVTHCVQANTTNFCFVKPFKSSEIIRKKGTLLAIDGADEIRTPYNNCLLVIPNLRPKRGHTAVRLAKPD